MPVMLLAAYALVLVQAPAPAAVDQVQELLEAIPEALIEGKRSGMNALVAKAKAGWDRAKPEIVPALHIPEADAAFIDRQLASMLKMKPREQAVGALGISGTLSRFQGRSRQQTILQADRAVMMSWCVIDGGQWGPLPNLGQVFKPLLEQDNGQHTVAIIGAKDALKRFDESLKQHKATGAKKALKDLLNLVDVLERP